MQNGYAEEGQWVITTMGKLQILKIEDNMFIGVDENGKEITGHMNDIIRTVNI